MEKTILVTLLLATILRTVALVKLAEEEAEVDKVTPKHTGIGGATQITISGKYFAKPKYGVAIENEVTLTDGGSDVPCRVFRDETTKKQIVCNPPQRTLVADTRYCVRVKVKGIVIPNKKLCNNQPDGDDCCIMAKIIFTPTIHTLEPTSMMPGPDMMIRICGRIFTSLYASDRAVAENGRTEKILRVYTPGECQLRDMSQNNGDDYYELWVAEDSNDGCMTCKARSTFVGNANVTYILEPPLGSSVADSDLLRVSWDDQIHMIQYYAAVTGLSKHAGSTLGGLVLRVFGNNFELGGTSDSNYAPAKIYVGETECRIIDAVKNSYFDCVVDKQTALDQRPLIYAGERGITVEIYPDGTHSTFQHMFEDVTPSSDTRHFDETRVSGDAIRGQEVRMRALYLATKTGAYQFQVRSTQGHARWYFGDEPQGESWGGWSNEQQDIELQEGEMYLLTVVALGPSSNPAAAGNEPIVELKSKSFDEIQMTFVWTGNSIPEEQILRLTSVQVPEEQAVGFILGTPQDSQPKVQRVCIIQGEDEFRLGMFNTFTDIVNINDLDKIAEALNLLLFLEPEIGELFEVTEDSTEGYCFIVILHSPRGNFPNLEVMGMGEFSVEELEPGVPDNDRVSLMIGNRPSRSFLLSTLDALALQIAVDSMLVTKCPNRFWKRSVWFEDFELGRADHKGGLVVRHKEPFCSKQSIRNPWQIFPSRTDMGDLETISLRTHATFYACMAYTGIRNARFVFKYRYVGGYDSWHGIDMVSLQPPTELTDWEYGCVNLKPTIGEGELLVAKLHGEYDDEFFVDALNFGPEAIFEESSYVEHKIREMRLLSASPKPEERVLIDHADVVYDDERDKYLITLFPLNCANNFELFRLLNSEGPADSGDSDSSEFTLQNGASRIETTREKHASGPLAGEVKLEFQQMKTKRYLRKLNRTNKRIRRKPISAARAARIERRAEKRRAVINVSWTADQIRHAIEGISKAGRVGVKFSPSCTCANCDIHLTFLTKPGRQNIWSVYETQLTSPASAEAEIIRYVEGHLLQSPILGDRLFTAHDIPQVQVFVNNVPSRCLGDCSFEWLESETPSILSLDRNEGNEGTALTITGDKFSEVLEENEVLVGGVPCAVTDSNGTHIICTVGNGAGYDRPVEVNVVGYGKASGDLRFSYVWGVTGIDPAVCSFGGGCEMSVYGSSLSEDSEVYVNGQLCPEIHWSRTEIVCQVPPANSPVFDTDLPAEVVVSLATETGTQTEMSPTPLTYSAAQTGVIESGSYPESLTVQGGDTIQFVGLGEFPADCELVIGDARMNPADRFESQDYGGSTTFTFETPSDLTVGPVVLGLDCLSESGVWSGFAVMRDSGMVPEANVVLRVDTFSPPVGSMYGGSILDFDGFGFGTTAADIAVTVGDYPCDVIGGVNVDHFQCQIRETAAVHVVTNMGDGEFGPYYSYDPPNLEINTGDIIEWRWSSPEWVERFHSVNQLRSMESLESLENGFSSGPPTPSGVYRERFTQEGEYDFWSGFVDEGKNIYYQGSVTVVGRLPSLEEINLTVRGQDAKFNVDTGSGSDPGRRRRGAPQGACEPTIPDETSCSDSDLTPPDPSKPYFKHCIAPTVTAVSYDLADQDLDQGITVDTELTFTAIGLPSDACAIDITLGTGEAACPCQVNESPTSGEGDEVTFKCTPGSICAREIGGWKEISASINTIGEANVQLSHHERFVAFLPTITSIDPKSGSAAGGTGVTIRGTGLRETNFFMFNTAYAECEYIDDLEFLKCISPKTRTGPIVIKKDAFPAICRVSGNPECEFKYDADLTPALTSVSPLSIDTADESSINIIGAKFGSVAANIDVIIGGRICSDVVVVSANTEITCKLTGLPAGPNLVDVIINRVGKAQPRKFITGVAVLNALPQESATGSIHGGKILTLTGQGFHEKESVVSVGEKPCILVETETVSVSRIVCITPDHEVADVKIKVTVGMGENMIFFPEIDFSYTQAATPVVEESDLPSGVPGQEITITGSGFGTDYSKVKVEVGGVECAIGSPEDVTDDSVTCTLGDHASGPADIVVNVADKGLSNPYPFDYSIFLDSIEPQSGDIKGNQKLSLHGKGFPSDPVVTVCNNMCDPDMEQSTSVMIVCYTPPGEAEGPCPVTVGDKTAADQYSYELSVAPIISSVRPPRGSTAGGTLVTISGSGFGSDSSAVTVTAEGNTCDIQNQSFSDTEIICVTNGNSHSTKTKMVITMGDQTAVAAVPGASDYYYIDAWSSKFTWGGETENIPQEGDFVVIEETQAVLLDVDTPILKMILIKGGILMFDDTRERTELQAEYILITEGGTLQIGTKEEPYMNKAVITLHGHALTPELPVYGAKTLALMSGTLSLHGKPIPHPWTRLTATAYANDVEIRLPDGHVTNWEIGDKLVIATTGDHYSQGQTEEKTIKDIRYEAGDAILELESPLEFTHTAITESYPGADGQDWEMFFSAEVGLLTRSILIRGSDNKAYHDKIEACDKKFDTGQFATQTCFQGRYGEELGSDQCGVQIMIHTPEENSQDAIAEIEYLEVTYAGQAFRLGRYPIHFHVNGDMDRSYVRGVSIHKSFNRAVVIHATHDCLIEHTIVYNIMGGAFFLEDGIEKGNILQYNLAVFIKPSTSLDNDDLTPAAFWVTSPSNILRHNVAAGNTHIGYWYRMLERPSGPSYNENQCPRQMPLGEFYHNLAHSNGRFGLWTFERFQPQKNENCKVDMNNNEPAKFDTYSSYNDRTGAEFVASGALQLYNSLVVQSGDTGFRVLLIEDVPKREVDNFCGLVNTTIVGHAYSDELQQPSQGVSGVTKIAITIPFGYGFQARQISVVNVDQDGTVGLFFTSIPGLSAENSGGYPVTTEGITFTETLKRGKFRWPFEAVIEDKSGMCGGPNEQKILPIPGTLLPPDTCTVCNEFDSSIVQAVRCPASMIVHTLAIRVLSPESLIGKDIRLSNEHGEAVGPFESKRLRKDYKPGYQMTLIDGLEYVLEFINGEEIENVSLALMLSDVKPGNCIIMVQKVQKRPDRFSFDGGETILPEYTDGVLECPGATFGQWNFNGTHVLYAISAPPAASRRKRGATRHPDDVHLTLTLYSCYYTDCIPPPPEDEEPPEEERNQNFTYSDEMVWYRDPAKPERGAISSIVNEAQEEDEEEGDPGRRKRGTNDELIEIPEGYDLTISKGDYIVVRYTDGLPQRLGTVLVLGELEFSDREEDGADRDFTLEVDFIIIKGGRLIVGWQDHRFEGLMTITLAGDKNSQYYYDADPNYKGPEVGAKAIGVFGGLDLHGKDVDLTWTTLTVTANAGAQTLYVSNDVTKWTGSIVITSTSYDPAETEERVIESTTENTIRLTTPLTFKHIAMKESISKNGEETEYGFAAAVGLLTRNIKIQSHPEESDQRYGGRIIVGTSKDANRFYTGFARISYVELVNMGQLGFTEAYDPRFALSFVSTGRVRESKPSFVKHNSFHDLFSPALGVVATHGMEVFDNVIYRPVGDGIVDTSDQTKYTANLVADLRSPSAYLNRDESFVRYEAGFNTFEGTRTVLESNYVGGGERAAYHVRPVTSSTCPTSTPDYDNANFGVSSLIGIVLFPGDKIEDKGCNTFSGSFKFWKILDYAVYVNNKNSWVISNIVTADCGVDVSAYVIEPSAVRHQFEHKTVQVKDSVFIKVSSSMDCSNSPAPTGKYVEQTRHCAGPTGPGGEKFGIISSQFYSGSNKAPEKKCDGIMSYPSMLGKTIVSGVVFKNFGLVRDCLPSFAMAANSLNDDYQPPVEASDNYMISVDPNFEAFIPRSNIGKVNPSDCQDMFCDGMKTHLFLDRDGTFLQTGNPAAIIPQAEFGYNDDDRRNGYGDYRIPVAMETTPDGDRIPLSDIRDDIGIARTEMCNEIYHRYPDGSSYAVYKCPTDNYETILAESMDRDTETRRLSPIGLRNHAYGQKFLDFSNGPQDHGWCTGYTCLKRLSTFYFVAVGGTQLDVYLSASNPEVMRFMFVNPRSDSCVRLVLFYTGSTRMDVYSENGDKFILPQNAIRKADGGLKYDSAPVTNHIPECSHVSGANVMDREAQLIYLILKGGDVVKVKYTTVVMVAFYLADVPIDEFFDEDSITENIRAILNIDPRRVRIVNVVRGNAAGGKRRKRSEDGGLTFQAEIGKEPALSKHLSESVSEIPKIDKAPFDAADETGEDEDGTEIADTLMTACQDSSIVPMLGVGAVVCEEVTVEDTVYVPAAPESLRFEHELAPQHEGVVFATQPRLRAYDDTGAVIDDLGIKQNPWQVTAALRNGTGHARAVLSGTKTISSVNGWFNFTDLAISHAGSGYIIDFAITYPASAAELNLEVPSAAFDVNALPMKAVLYAMTSGDITQGSEFSFTLELRDKTTDVTIEDITWRDHTFDVDCGLPSYTEISSLTGNLSKTYDEITGRVQFDEIVLTGYGPIIVECHVVSTPPEYDFPFYQKVYVVGTSQVGMPRGTSQIIKLRFIDDFNTILPTEALVAQLEQMVLQDIVKKHPNIVVIDSSITPGSIVVTLTVEGSLENVTVLNQDLCTAIAEKQSYSLGSVSLILDAYMTVDGQDYFAASCGESESKDGLHPGYIALIAVLAVLLVVLVVLLVLWKLHVIPKTKTHGANMRTVESLSIHNVPDNGKTVYLGAAQANVLREPTLESAKSFAPMNTLYSSHVEVDLRRTPTPTGQRTLYSERTMSPSPSQPKKNGALTPTGH